MKGATMMRDRISLPDVARKMRDRRDEHRLQDLDRDNTRLRTELHALSAELDREREERSSMLEMLRSRPENVKVKIKKRGWIRTLVVGGTAYVLGTRAGRERFDRMVEWVRGVRDRTQRLGDERSRLENAGTGEAGSRISPPNSSVA